jgi:hypothetical protein
MTAMRILGAPVAFLAVAACATEPPVDPETPRSRVDLRQAIASGADVTPTGTAVAPNGDRFVFDAALGLYRIDGASAVEVVRMDQMPPPNVPVRPPFTDLVAISPDVFAITAIGDGFMLDVAAMTLTQRFCYVPEELPETLDQRTDAITYDVAQDFIFAQPRTYDVGDNLISAQMAGYQRETGAIVAWQDVDIETNAGGMAVLPELGLVLGQGSRLTRYDMVAVRFDPVDDLARFGISDIAGLAVDPVAGTLTVLDGGSDELVEIDLAAIGE